MRHAAPHTEGLGNGRKLQLSRTPIAYMAAILETLFGLRDKVALITGASGGIGGALAEGFSAAGAAVAVHGSRRDKVDSVCNRIKENGGNARGFCADLKDHGASKQLVGDVVRELGRLDVLVNCAGTNRRKPVRDFTEDDFDSIVAVNLKSLLFLAQAAYPIMRAQGGGKIINIGSITSTDGLAGVGIYGATKAAVGQLTKTMALEWAQDNIQVNCLAPGFIRTPLTEAGLWNDPHRRRWILERVAAGRPGEPKELVGAALLLAGGGSSFITGQIFNVDGGYLAGGSWLKPGE